MAPDSLHQSSYARAQRTPTRLRTTYEAGHKELRPPEARVGREDPRSREGVSNLVDWNPRTSWHEDQGGPQKKSKALVAIVVPKNGCSGERQVCQGLMEPDSNVTVMIEIAEGFAQDLYQEGAKSISLSKYL